MWSTYSNFSLFELDLRMLFISVITSDPLSDNVVHGMTQWWVWVSISDRWKRPHARTIIPKPTCVDTCIVARLSTIAKHRETYHISTNKSQYLSKLCIHLFICAVLIHSLPKIFFENLGTLLAVLKETCVARCIVARLSTFHKQESIFINTLYTFIYMCSSDSFVAENVFRKSGHASVST